MWKGVCSHRYCPQAEDTAPPIPQNNGKHDAWEVMIPSCVSIKYKNVFALERLVESSIKNPLLRPQNQVYYWCSYRNYGHHFGHWYTMTCKDIWIRVMMVVTVMMRRGVMMVTFNTYKTVMCQVLSNCFPFFFLIPLNPLNNPMRSHLPTRKDITTKIRTQGNSAGSMKIFSNLHQLN